MVSFEELGVDIISNIFKYLNLVERVKYERVSNDIRSTLLMLWRHQSRLKITYDGHIQEKMCFNKSHRFYNSDIINFGQWRPFNGRIRIEIILRKLLERATNLKAFSINITDDKVYGHELSSSREKFTLPSTIEHLASSCFKSLDIMNMDQLVCVIDYIPDIFEYDGTMNGSGHIPDGPNVTYFYCPSVHHSGKLRIKNFDRAIQAHGNQLLSGLRELDLNIEARSFFLSLNPTLCPKIERLKITGLDFVDEPSKSDKFELIRKYGNNLTNLVYYQHYYVDQVLDVDLIDYTMMANTLEELSLEVIDFRHFGQYKFVFSKLRKLRVVNVRQASWSSFCQMLVKCPKLRYLDFSRLTVPLPMLNPIVCHLNKFANDHPKRQITFATRNAKDVDFNCITSRLFVQYSFVTTNISQL